MAKKPTGWRDSLQDKELARWHGKLALSSIATADERLRVLLRVCKGLRTTPAQMAKDAKEDRRGFEARLQDFVILLRKPHKPSDHGEDEGDKLTAERCKAKEGHAPSYVGALVKAIRSWLDHNDILLRRIVVGGNGSMPTVENEKVPEAEELRGVLDAAGGLRAKVIISFVAFAGVRPEVLGKGRAEGGLVLGDLPEISIAAGRVRILRDPMQIVVPPGLSKVGRKYITFLPRPATDWLREYLQGRLARGEKLTKDSPVVRPDYGRERQGRPEAMRGSLFLGVQGVTGEIRDALRARGFRVRPYVLRSYAAMALHQAQRDQKLTDLDREFFLGRSQAITLVYSHFKSLSKQRVEELRTAYKGAVPYLLGVESGEAEAMAESLTEGMARQNELLERFMSKLDPSEKAQLLGDLARELARGHGQSDER